MMRLIFIVIAFLVMVGGLIGGLYFWGVDPLAKFNALVGNAPADPNAKVAVVLPPSFVEFGLLIVPVVQDREVKKQAEMIIRLEVPYEKKERVAQNLPRLQNAFLQEMMSFLPGHLRTATQMDHSIVQRRLLVQAEKVLGPGMVKDVLIEQSTVK
jgi:flagellar FliL protein